VRFENSGSFSPKKPGDLKIPAAFCRKSREIGKFGQLFDEIAAGIFRAAI